MNNHKDVQSQNLFFYVFLLVFWGMASLYIFINFIPRFSLIAVALLLFLFILSLTELFPFAPWVGFILSALVFSGVVYSLLENTREILITSGIGVGIFLMTALFCVFYNRQIHKLRRIHDHLQQAVDSLVIYDRKTSLMRWKFAQQALTTEIHRSRRYNIKLSVILFEIWQKSQYPAKDLDRIYLEMADIIQETVREDIDIAFIGDRIGLILPETENSGAKVLAERLIKKFNRSVDARISAGIASFPENAVTEDELMNFTEQRLMIAMNAGKEILSHQTLETRAEEEEEQEFKEENLEETSTDETNLESAAKTTKKVEVSEESNEPVNMQEQHPEKKDYVQALKKINLDEDEWIIWIPGFNQMANLVNLEKQLLGIEHVQEVEFLFLQANHLVMRIKSSLEDLPKAERAFPGWRIHKSDTKNHYLLLSSE